MKIVSLIFLLISAFLGVKHGWETLHINNYFEQAVEIPFLDMALLLIWLKYPFKF